MTVVTASEFNQRLGKQAPWVSLIGCLMAAIWLIWSWMSVSGPLPILLVSAAALFLVLFLSLVLEQMLETSVVLFSWIFSRKMHLR